MAPELMYKKRLTPALMAKSRIFGAIYYLIKTLKVGNLMLIGPNNCM